jgi:hypothetical protein
MTLQFGDPLASLEPGTLLLLGSGLISVSRWRRGRARD